MQRKCLSSKLLQFRKTLFYFQLLLTPSNMSAAPWEQVRNSNFGPLKGWIMKSCFNKSFRSSNKLPCCFLKFEKVSFLSILWWFFGNGSFVGGAGALNNFQGRFLKVIFSILNLFSTHLAWSKGLKKFSLHRIKHFNYINLFHHNTFIIFL